MRIHNQIRKEVLDYLVANMKGIKSFYNGVPKITNVKAELPLICVTLENAQANQHVVGGQEWEADLNIMILAPFGGSEPVLDELAEEVYQLLKIQSFKSISMKYAQGYDYPAYLLFAEASNIKNTLSLNNFSSALKQGLAQYKNDFEYNAARSTGGKVRSNVHYKDYSEFENNYIKQR